MLQEKPNHVRVKRKVLNFFLKKTKELRGDRKLFVFGSRAFLDKKGGDLDLLVLSKEKLSLRERMLLAIEFKKEFGDQKIDIVSFDQESKNLFLLYILEHAIEIK